MRRARGAPRERRQAARAHARADSRAARSLRRRFPPSPPGALSAAPRAHVVANLLLKWGASTAAIDAHGRTPYEIVLARFNARVERGDHPNRLGHDAMLCCRLMVAGAALPDGEQVKEIFRLSSRAVAANR